MNINSILKRLKFFISKGYPFKAHNGMPYIKLITCILLAFDLQMLPNLSLVAISMVIVSIGNLISTD